MLENGRGGEGSGVPIRSRYLNTQNVQIDGKAAPQGLYTPGALLPMRGKLRYGGRAPGDTLLARRP